MEPRKRRIRIAGFGGKRMVSAELIGSHLAVHREVKPDPRERSKAYVVTHVESGMGVSGLVEGTLTREQALLLARDIDGLLTYSGKLCSSDPAKATEGFREAFQGGDIEAWLRAYDVNNPVRVHA